MISFTDFLEKFSYAIEDENAKNLKPNDSFRSLDNWDSLSEMSIIAMIDQEFNLTIKTSDMNSLITIQQLYDYIQSKCIND